MLRVFLSLSLVFALAAVAAAQAPKKLPRIAINDPAKLKDNPDFAVQGEYVSTMKAGDITPKGKVGIQVIAEGDGRFRAVVYGGGLPGSGWNGKQPNTMPAVRENGKVAFKSEKRDIIGHIADGAIILDASSRTFVKVMPKSPTLGAKPPAGAVVLYGGPEDVSKWNGGKVVELSDGKFLGVGETSKQAFGAFHAHVEFRLPWMPNSRGQGRGNSGVYVQNRYEIQVLDSFGLKGENNECGGIYTQYKPSVNMCLPPMQWQTYDIDFTPATFDAAGKKTGPARLTVLHNGVKIHDNIALKGSCPGGQPETPKPGPFQLQNHGDPVVYRNIWVVEKK
jgi:hypothetical protein